MPRRRRTEDSKELQPSLNRFAEDTSMLGFRYLHTRYKTWFRLVWALVLTFFVGLTVYQVFERIAYYFIRNPLTTRRSYDSPQHMHFPTIGICNKMQLKASAFAAREPELLRFLSLTYDDAGQVTENRTVLEALGMFDNVDSLSMHRAAHQKVEDLFLSCEIGKKGSCIDDIRPILTQQGLCFVVSPNMTVRRPGPETTLSMLLNLEVYEIIPGTVSDSGVILSIHDPNDSSSQHHTDGIHLEAGKLVTIPINEVRKLSRYSEYCGRRAIGPFSRRQYSRESCEWVSATQAVEKACKCRPVNSPYNRNTFADQKMRDVYLYQGKPHRRLKPCTIKQEFDCVAKFASQQLDAVADSKQCPENCEDVTFSSVVFGGRLTSSDVSPFLPSDWEDIKESKVAEFQRALDVIPSHRIPVVREVQSLAESAQEFAQLTEKIFSLLPNVVTVPCLAPKGARELERAMIHFKSREPMWERITTYLMRSLSRELNSTASALGLFLKSDGSIDGQASFAHNESMVAFSLLQLGLLENRTGNSFGLRIMDVKTRERLLEFVVPFIRDLRSCLMKIHDNAERSSEIAEDCRRIFREYYDVLLDAKKVYALGDQSSIAVVDYTSNMGRIVTALRRFMFVNRVQILNWHDFEIDLKEFESLDGGSDNLEIHELMKLRKLMLSDILEYIGLLKTFYEQGLQARRNVLRRLGIVSPRHQGLTAIETTITCLVNISNEIPLIKKSAFVRGEWLSRIQRQVEIAQSYSATPQYDQVNLLHVKLYFAHFKQEIIVQERSYNMFLLLAEIGGTIGLYVGATLLTVAETIVFFFEERTRKVLVKPAYL
ncbi:hypothetical protein Y032_0019g3907 [Ancylostoma ceylanicum]|uniref:Amiloride-sensitive sodium channel n=1 Tax=Ancylostoma ceylanicum TaxID=53326 RepID=A0A016V3M1_9BILA|nr:hypothetical protein Y032_0019g3907 [Ancylostoma ceylanicum]